MTNDNNETNAYQALMYEDAKCIAPIFYREVEHDNECILQVNYKFVLTVMEKLTGGLDIFTIKGFTN